VHTPYWVLYSCFPSRSWWRFLLMSATFWIRLLDFHWLMQGRQ
jgi:hypothetical protein